MSDNRLLSYYGDDLTGSTDVLEALSRGGVEAVLFMRVPDATLLARFADCRAIGLAGTSRSETSEWMEDNLDQAFRWLKSLGAAICHYKVCSTFDSSPAVGNIGRAIEIGRKVFEQQCVPLIVGAPQMKRYTAFGNLFAAFRGENYRIDRHPVMSRHPVTPMREADLLRHLALQTKLRSALIDLAALRSASLQQFADQAASTSDILLFDVADAETQRLAGREVWRLRQSGGSFVAGSSGVEYALLAKWIEAGRAKSRPSFANPGPVDRIAVVSGSVSPTTEKQIMQASVDGFDAIAVDPLKLSGEDGAIESERATRAGLVALSSGRSVVLYTALGPQADQGGEIDQRPGARNQLGRALGDILKNLVVGQRLARAVIAGGDTSSHALGQLGIDALTVCTPLKQSPGGPLCIAHSSIADTDGLQVAMKGGQIGADDYFCAIRDGVTS
jgi:uncharacterized protein YgbK (DUF1537 family)